MDKLIIIDEMKKKQELTLTEVLGDTPEKRYNRLIGHDLPEAVQDYYNDANAAREAKRREKMTDAKLENKLYVLLKSIDTSAMNPKEEHAFNNILSKYRN